MFSQISQNSQENTNKEIPAQMFSSKFWEISHNIIFKELFGRLFQHKHAFCLLLHLHFQKRCHTYFLAEYFFGLICTLATRVSSIFQALSPTPIFNPVEYLQWSVSIAKVVNNLKPLSIFAKKPHCDQVLNLVRPGSKYASVSSH